MLNLDNNKFNVVSRRRGRGKPESLRLTSMIDMFTILLVFLLKSYSADGQIMTVSDDLRLPNSTANKPPVSAPVIAVTTDAILLDDDMVASVADVVNSDQNIIANLGAGLQQKKQMTEELAQVSDAIQFKGEVIIQGDKEIPFRILKKIMMTCGRVGYSDIKLVVIKAE